MVVTRDLTPIVVVGAGGFGRETLDILMACNGSVAGPLYQILGVVDSGPSAANLERLRRMGIEYLGTESEWLDRSRATQYLVGIGDPSIRRTVSERFDAAGHPPGVAVHPSATLGSLSFPSPGMVACSGVQVSTNVVFGRHVHLNANASIGHDTVIHDYVSVNPGAVISGDVLCGEGLLVGAGAVVLQGRAIGAGSVVGAASCVTRDVAVGVTVKGVPAK